MSAVARDNGSPSPQSQLGLGATDNAFVIVGTLGVGFTMQAKVTTIATWTYALNFHLLGNHMGHDQQLRFRLPFDTQFSIELDGICVLQLSVSPVPFQRNTRNLNEYRDRSKGGNFYCIHTCLGG